MVIDILSNILRQADHPGKTGTYLTAELRELTGANCVSLIHSMEYMGSPVCRLVGLNPERRRKSMESPLMADLFQRSCQLDQERIWLPGEESHEGRILSQMGFGLSIAVPLMIGSLHIGSLLILGMPDNQHITSVLELFKMLSTTVALVLRNASLYEYQEQIIADRTRQLSQTNIALKESEERYRNIATHARLLADMSEALAAAVPNLSAVLQAAVEQLSHGVGYICLIHLLTDDGTYLRPVVDAPKFLDWDGSDLIWREICIETGQAPQVAVVTEGQPVFTPSISAGLWSTLVRPGLPSAIEFESLRSLWVIPLRAQGEVFGTVTLFWKNTELPSAALEQTFLQDLADRVGMAILNARLFEQVEAYSNGLEQRVHERTAQLEEAVHELEAFSYTVSHDLRAPLRAMNGFSHILVEDFGPDLVPEAQHYLELVQTNAQKMGQLVDDLLAFSRLGRQSLNQQWVYPTELVRQAMDELAAEYVNRQLEWLIGDLPPCTADRALLKQVLVNLLSNALKFTRTRSVARIEVGAMPSALSQAGFTTYFVRDNGVGFDMQYVGKLFSVFQRLHRSEDYEGTGVGLAIVNRIVQRHGGRAWAEATVDQGATFYFSLRNIGNGTIDI
jgi:signal transduction histidine kinase